MFLFPMAVSAAAVIVTLVYASYLDIRDRRVPFITWMPMLAIGITCTAYLLAETTGNASLVAGYLALVAAFLYADYLDNRGRTDSFGLAGYYGKPKIGWYLVPVLCLPVLSWFVLAPVFIIQLVPWYAMFAGITMYVSYMEYRGRFDEKQRQERRPRETALAEAIGRWWFVAVIVIFAITSVLLIFSGGWGTPGFFILFPVVFAGVFYLFGRMNLFGGADAWALIFISFAVPTFPFTPLLGDTPLGFLSFSVLINALLLNLAAPLGIFAVNVMKGNRAPLMYLFFGFPVKGDEIQKSWGFVMEDIGEKDGKVTRRFIGFFDSIRRMYAGEGRIYTKDLRENPQDYKKELLLYKKAGSVWISYAVPFIIPILAGFVTAIILGDLLLAIMRFVIGGV